MAECFIFCGDFRRRASRVGWARSRRRGRNLDPDCGSMPYPRGNPAITARGDRDGETQHGEPVPGFRVVFGAGTSAGSGDGPVLEGDCSRSRCRVLLRVGVAHRDQTMVSTGGPSGRRSAERETRPRPGGRARTRRIPDSSTTRPGPGCTSRARPPVAAPAADHGHHEPFGGAARLGLDFHRFLEGLGGRRPAARPQVRQPDVVQHPPAPVPPPAPARPARSPRPPRPASRPGEASERPRSPSSTGFPGSSFRPRRKASCCSRRRPGASRARARWW